MEKGQTEGREVRQAGSGRNHCSDVAWILSAVQRWSDAAFLSGPMASRRPVGPVVALKGDVLVVWIFKKSLCPGVCVGGGVVVAKGMGLGGGGGRWQCSPQCPSASRICLSIL